MPTNTINRSAIGLAALGALIHGGVIQAGGFQLTELSARHQGSRNAGAAAVADEPSTVFFNPAGLTRLKGRQVQAAAHVIIPKFELKDESSTNGIGGEATGKRKDDGGQDALVPNLYASMELTDRLVAGLGIVIPYGLATEYDNDWVGRYNAVRSELVTIDVNPALAYRINDRLSIGAGFSVQYLDVELTNAIDFGTAGFLAGRPGITPSTREFDGQNKLTGDDLAWGYNLGVLFEPIPGTRLGASYRSEVDYNIRGRARVRFPEFLQTETGQESERRNAEADFESPATIWLGAYHEINDQWAILAGATWTDWSAFEELAVRFGDREESVQPENWSDSWRYSIGTAYKLNPQWTVRAGFEYDESPVDNSDRTPRIPDQDRYWLTFGASYQYSDAFAFDFAYTHIFIPDYSIRDTELGTGDIADVPVGNTLDGEYEADANIISAQVRWVF